MTGQGNCRHIHTYLARAKNRPPVPGQQGTSSAARAAAVRACSGGLGRCRTRLRADGVAVAPTPTMTSVPNSRLVRVIASSCADLLSWSDLGRFEALPSRGASMMSVASLAANSLWPEDSSPKKRGRMSWVETQPTGLRAPWRSMVKTPMVSGSGPPGVVSPAPLRLEAKCYTGALENEGGRTVTCVRAELGALRRGSGSRRAGRGWPRGLPLRGPTFIGPPSGWCRVRRPCRISTPSGRPHPDGRRGV